MLTLVDYLAAADKVNLDFIGEVHDKKTHHKLESDFNFYICGGAPTHAINATYWRCRLTGKVLHKAIGAVQRGQYGSRYQRAFYGTGGTYQKYKNLAKRLNIVFLYDPIKEFFPATTKTPCRWLSDGGKIIITPYHDLGYDIITTALSYQLGLSEVR